MDKIAQRMGKLKKLREKLSPTGKLEEFFKPEFKEVMESLRLGDDSIRSIVAGEQLGDGDPGKDHIALKALLESAKSNTNRREYMMAVSDLSRFHAKLREIVAVLGKINGSLDKVHHQFLFQDVGDEHKPHIEDLENRWKAAAAARQAEFTKVAGITSGVMDLWHNLTDERGKSLRSWEKKYPKKTQDLKKGLVALIESGKKTLSDMITTLKELGSLRATRKPEEYMGLARSSRGILGSYNNFDKVFQSIYNGNGKGFSLKQLVSDFKSFNPVSKEEANQMGDQSVPVEKDKMVIPTNFGPGIKTDVSVPPNAPSHLSMPPMPAPGAPAAPGSTEPDTLRDPVTQRQLSTPPVSDPRVTMPSVDNTPTSPAGPPSAMVDPHLPYSRTSFAPPSPSAPQTTRMSPEEMRALETQHGISAESHKKFYASLQSMSGENPLILAGFISKYAAKIQASDPTTSIQLLKIVKRIKG